MNNTALGAENKKKQTINFISEAHEKFYYEKLKEVRNQDVYHKALCYCLGISDDTRRNINSIYDFKTGCVKTECLHEGWQTSGSMKVIRMAFNLYCNGTPSVDEYTEAEEQLNECRQYAVDDLFCCAYEEEMEPQYGILHHSEGIDLMPGNIELSGLEVSLVNVMSRETILRTYIEQQKDRYDYILIDCMPSLGMITINAFASADSILIPVQAAYLPVKGLEQLIKTIGKVKRQINPKLEIEGILLTMVDNRTNYARDISNLLIENYGSRVRIFENSIPLSVRAAEISAEGVSIYQHDPNGKVASAYQSLTEEVLANE